jgi:hypothetical protein
MEEEQGVYGQEELDGNVRQQAPEEDMGKVTPTKRVPFAKKHRNRDRRR